MYTCRYHTALNSKLHKTCEFGEQLIQCYVSVSLVCSKWFFHGRLPGTIHYWWPMEEGNRG